MDHSLIVASLQHACINDTPHNLHTSCSAICDAANQGAQIVLLQELHTSLYFCQIEDKLNYSLAETIPGNTTETLGSLARELGIVIVGSIFERRAAGIYHNTAVVMDTDGSLAGIYRKMHIPDDPGYYEKYYFTPGDLGFQPVQTSLGRLGVLICWDQWFPEAARLMALAGAELLLYPSAIGWDSRDSEQERLHQRAAWITMHQSHAIANGLPVICSNRHGFESDPSGITPGIEFWGSSFICGPQGEILTQGSDNADAVVMASIDMHRSEEIRQLWPYLRDRRIDAYGEILQRYRK